MFRKFGDCKKIDRQRQNKNSTIVLLVEYEKVMKKIHKSVMCIWAIIASENSNAMHTVNPKNIWSKDSKEYSDYSSDVESLPSTNEIDIKNHDSVTNIEEEEEEQKEEDDDDDSDYDDNSPLAAEEADGQ